MATQSTGREERKEGLGKQTLNADNIKKMREAGEDETSFDSAGSDDVSDGYDAVPNPTRENKSLDKEIDIERHGGGKAGQTLKQQEQQQTSGIPTMNSKDGDSVARRAGMNSGTQGIGTGSAQGYEGNTDDSGLDALGEDVLADGTDDDIVGQDLAGVDLTGAGGSDIDDVGDESRSNV